MKKVLDLGNHSVKEVVDNLTVYFKSRKMASHVVTTINGSYELDAHTPNLDITDKVFGDEMKCHVQIKEHGHGKVEITAEGKLKGKVIGAVVVTGGALFVPASWPYVLAAGGCVLSAGKNVVTQARLSSDVINFAEAFLS